ncbi:superoxide dismutase family protein Rsod isoform X1 [Rhodnius prolixus]|uniref:superoxide dismutase family protein Rsod isoform X1 n=1 Tax=Rhodnius prolixus TaxID=13249 RepID=UPI003D187948
MLYLIKENLIPGLLVELFLISQSLAVELTAHISENGLHGFVTMFEDNGAINVYTKLSVVGEWSWNIRELPVDYTELNDRCTDRKLGTILIDLTQLVGPISSNTSSLTTRSDQLSLIGQKGLWTRSILLQSASGERACATLMASGNSSVEIAEADFTGENGLNGKVLVQWFGSSSATDAVIYTDLYHVHSQSRSTHHWRIYSTDILESDADREKENCNSLQEVLLDLSTRLGELKVGERQLIRDPGLQRLDILNPKRYLYLVLIDNHHPDTFFGCARLKPKHPTFVKALVMSHGVTGYLSLEQESILTPTRAVLNITRVMDPVLGGFRIHMLPALPPIDGSPILDQCRQISNVYNPTDKGIAAHAPVPGMDSQDRYAVGDVSGKIGYAGEREWDSFLPLIGKHSVVHRSLVIYRNGESGVEEPWICSTLTRYLWDHPEYKMPVVTAEAFYRYPIVGRIIFHQPAKPYYGETTILIEGLVYSDGTSLNTTNEHRWGIHINPPGKDYFNWTARCVSAGPVFNPHKVNETVNAESVIGDLSKRLAHLVISGSKSVILESRTLFTLDNLPLSGLHSILGKSLVIFDDHGPKARGDRLACSKITSIFRRKAVARNWFGNGFQTSVSGKIEFFQQTEYGITDIEMNIEGLEDVKDYQVAMTPVLEILEFPCEETTLYGVYNPHSANTYQNQGATPDQFPVGDLSGKFGHLLGHSSVQKVGYNDSNLMIFGQTSILGRSLVFTSHATRRRWACSTIERGYAPSEARELRAIASFHHPNGFAYGYMRMTQLIHNDGSSSDTVIEVNVRHPGKHDRNITFHHNWAIYVNPVGVDAAVKILNTRCTAAGYIWNPYYTQLADPLNDELYRRECGPDLPLRCYVGDLSGRLGTIDLGNGRKVFSDPNLPLEGKVSAMGRSIVILNKERGSDKFACANIEPDYDTIKYVNVRRPPKFVVSQFLEDIRKVLGVPDWFLTVDSRKTNILYNGACIQLLIHFKGPQANKLEQDFSRLLSSGRLSEPSLYIPGYIHSKKRPSTVSYKLCSTSPTDEKSFSLRGDAGKVQSSQILLMIPLLLFVFKIL